MPFIFLKGLNSLHQWVLELCVLDTVNVQKDPFLSALHLDIEAL